jgi:hypothetical protein
MGNDHRAPAQRCAQGGFELGVFNAICNGPLTAAELASRASVAERAMRILCDFLTVHGFIAKADGHYSHTPTSAMFLDSQSPASMAGTLPFLMNDKVMKATELLTETIRQNRTALAEPVAGEEVREWVTFARIMQPMMAAAAEFIAGVIMRAGMPAKMLNVAASHGLFGIAVARLRP